MCVTQGVYEVADLQGAHLGDEVSEQRIRSDVERHAEKDVGRALIELTREPPLRHVELKHHMAWRQRHVGKVSDVPSTDDMAAGIGNGLDGADHAGELVDVTAARCRPAAPLV